MNRPLACPGLRRRPGVVLVVLLASLGLWWLAIAAGRALLAWLVS